MLGYDSYIVMAKITLSVALKAVIHAPYLCMNYTACSSDNGDI